MFILGSAAKAKKLPHMSKARKLRGENNEKADQALPEDPPAPVDLLDIL